MSATFIDFVYWVVYFSLMSEITDRGGSSISGRGGKVRRGRSRAWCPNRGWMQERDVPPPARSAEAFRR